MKNLGINLHAALEEFQRHVLKKRFNELSEPITLLFDEVHDDDNWSKTLKILYDEARTAFILCTGSSALLLNSTADLSRRMHTLKVYPFSFSELLNAKNALAPEKIILSTEAAISDELKQTLFFSESAENVMSSLTEIAQRIHPVFKPKQCRDSSTAKSIH